MCYHKSVAATYQDLSAHYSAAFQSLTEDMEPIRTRFSILMSKKEYTKEETQELTWLQKTLNSFTDTGIKRYHENGFDFLPMPIITSGTPDQFKLFRWGLIPFF